MSDSKRQSLIMLGIALIMVSALLFYISLSQPSVAEEESVIDTTVSAGDISSSAVASSYSATVAESSSDYVTASTSAFSYAADNAESETEAVATQSQTTASSAAAATVGIINLNTCTASDLQAVPGIGEVRAEAIIQYREYLGSYTSVEQIKNIKGIGDKIYEKASPYLTV